MITAAAAALVVAGLAVSSPAEQARERRRARAEAGCLQVQVTSPQSPGNRRPASFSATAILDLRLEVKLPRGVDPNRRIAVKLFTPDGHLYQDLELSADETENGEGSPPRGRRRRASAATPKSASALLPVAGTSIVTGSLYGEWTASPYIDGTESLCSQPASFFITQ